jgi:A/G-specific adenine glycosylase
MDRASALQRRLLRWFKRHRRAMPWRGAKDPYAIWVSEIMLQQTQVAAVTPYFLRFLNRFPNVRALARARMDAVLKAWEGMGYYSRARNLHRAAREVVSRFGGRLPATAPELLTLPGIGRYTAGAIASIAFGQDEPVLDGNVTRVLCRVFRIRKDPKAAAVRDELWSLARRLVPPERAGLFNQALMDLGATVCAPRNPGCPNCPIAADCGARAHGEQDAIPVKRPRKPTPHHDIAAGVIRRAKRILIDQRKADGLLGGLWEFPGGKRQRGEALKACLRREVREELGIGIRVLRPLITVEHAYSHFCITLHAYECRHVSGAPRALGCADWKWVTLEELDRYAFPAANRRIITALRS